MFQAVEEKLPEPQAAILCGPTGLGAVGIGVQWFASPKFAMLNLTVILLAAIGLPLRSTELLCGVAVKILLLGELTASIWVCEWLLVMSVLLPGLRETPKQVAPGSCVPFPHVATAGVFVSVNTPIELPASLGQKFSVTV